ncbi:MAG: hypothetical protein LBE27_08560 [Deltaproteobacteria bacterium]|nr:hypothetical protein [Deltaproteobacteria bacterium]
MSKKALILVMAPTPAEYAMVFESLSKKTYTNFEVSVLESGPGKINAAMRLSEELSLRRNQPLPVIVVGAGTSGSLNLSLKGGDVLASSECVISDWRHEDGNEVWVAPYGVFDYSLPEDEKIQQMLIREEDPLIVDLMDRLHRNGFQSGRILTSDTFVSGKDYKLALGKVFGADICDMESASFAYTAQQRKAKFFNLRVVADTLDETLSDYFAKETDVARILGEKVSEALTMFDEMYT